MILTQNSHDTCCSLLFCQQKENSSRNYFNSYNNLWHVHAFWNALKLNFLISKDLEYPFCKQTSKHWSVADSLAMEHSVDASEDLESKAWAAWRTISRDVIRAVAISASLNWMCWNAWKYVVSGLLWNISRYQNTHGIKYNLNELTLVH